MLTHRKRFCAQGGFSMIEVTTGLMVLMLGALAVASMQAYNVKQAIVAQESFAADELASQVMEMVITNQGSAGPIAKRSIRSCTDSGWTGDVCAALKEAVLRDWSGTERLRDAEVELLVTGNVWTANIYWKIGNNTRIVSNSVRL